MTTEIEQLRTRLAALEGVCAEAYQLAGAVGPLRTCSTSSTRSRMVVGKLLRPGIDSSFEAADARMPDHQQRP
jgi:hypothetical protein